MATKVVHIDHPGGTDTERVLGGYVWNRANNHTVVMLDSHADLLKNTAEAGEFKFEPVDPNEADPSAAATAFAKLKPGKEVETPAASHEPTTTNYAVEQEGHDNA